MCNCSEEIALRWSPSVANGSPVTGYEVTCRTGTQDYTSDNPTVRGTNATITELTNGTLYECGFVHNRMLDLLPTA